MAGAGDDDTVAGPPSSAQGVPEQIWEQIGPHVPLAAAFEKAFAGLKPEEVRYARARAEKVIESARPSGKRQQATPVRRKPDRDVAVAY